MIDSLFDSDVFVLGGGPAGLAAAIAARRRGFSVTLADADRPPIDKACGEGLMPDSLVAAAELGIDIPRTAGFLFRGISFTGPASTAAANFPHGEGLGVRRTVLHSLLVDAATRAGVEMLWGTPVTGIEDHTVQTQSGPRTARWIVGADGGQSMARRWTGLSAVRREASRFGFRIHYRTAPWSDYVEIQWSEGCQFYVTPVAADEVCVVLMSRDPHLRVADALPRFPALSARLQGITAVTPERGAFAATRRLQRVARGHVALIGDASGTIDAITGEGICLAFQQSLALAAALEAGDLRLYAAAHARLSRMPVFMADFMLTMDRSSWIQRRALAALSARPDLFSNLLAAHVGRLNLAQFAATAATLGWEIATA
jgi:flavin-dependent dehydrogenase